MIDYKEVFENFNRQHVLVIGDVMLDSYTFGDVTRISPEAPVPIVNVDRLENRLGGAANVALNLKSLGSKVTVCAPIGTDDAGATIKNLLIENNISIEGFIELNTRRTTIKNRVIANKHQLLRLDTETTFNLFENENNIFIDKIKSIIKEQNINAIVFEDYDKGAISKDLIEEIVALAKQRGIPTAVDPKKRNFANYSGTTLFKPNLRELFEGIEFQKSKEILIDNLDEIGKQFCIKNDFRYLFTTLSEHGVFICDSSQSYQEDAHLRSIADVSGAGDTVIAVATLCLALALPMNVIAQVSNIAGGLVCEKLGVVPINKSELLNELTKLSSNT